MRVSAQCARVLGGGALDYFALDIGELRRWHEIAADIVRREVEGLKK